MSDKSPVIVWFRQDLRLHDHAALVAAVDSGRPVIPVYIWSPAEEGAWAYGGAKKWWLHHSLKALNDSLVKLGSNLILRAGQALDVLNDLIKETGASSVYWSRRYEPAIIKRDSDIKEQLRKSGIEAESYNASLLWEPWVITTKTGGPCQVYTPFWKNCLAHSVPAEPLPTPDKLISPAKFPVTKKLTELKLLPTIDWADEFPETWEPGELAGVKRLESFLDSKVPGYQQERNRPDVYGTSRLSPYLHFGEVSPRLIWHEVVEHFGRPRPEKKSSADVYLSEVVWREFGYHLLYHFPQTPTEPLRPKYAAFPWVESKMHYRAWSKGLTGYPIVDAGMRELWRTGWMHNRVRMIVASFLTKHLLISWQHGAAWFWDTLLDADLASNTFGWQWSAGCGADAAPYFRIFHPVIQGEKFDPEGIYVRKYVPELANLPNEWIHKPFEAPPLVLKEAGIKLGATYPKPIVDHKEARAKALGALASIAHEELG